MSAEANPNGSSDLMADEARLLAEIREVNPDIVPPRGSAPNDMARAARVMLP